MVGNGTVLPTPSLVVVEAFVKGPRILAFTFPNFFCPIPLFATGESLRFLQFLDEEKMGISSSTV
jgi:hypothetical protein